METLESLKEAFDSYKTRLEAKKKEKQSYFNTAKAIGDVYDRLSDDKEVIKSYRNSVKNLRKEKYDTFKGNLYSSTYKDKLEELIDDYDVVIDNIDTNMDRLNTQKTYYENLGYKCNGPIGTLQSTVNSIWTKIENWVN